MFDERKNDYEPAAAGVDEPVEPEESDEDEMWECLLCLQIISGYIWQCKNGHILCGDCHVQIKNTCPSCGIALEGIRNRALERARDRSLRKRQAKEKEKEKQAALLAAAAALQGRDDSSRSAPNPWTGYASPSKDENAKDERKGMLMQGWFTAFFGAADDSGKHKSCTYFLIATQVICLVLLLTLSLIYTFTPYLDPYFPKKSASVLPHTQEPISISTPETRIVSNRYDNNIQALGGIGVPPGREGLEAVDTQQADQDAEISLPSPPLSPLSPPPPPPLEAKEAEIPPPPPPQSPPPPPLVEAQDAEIPPSLPPLSPLPLPAQIPPPSPPPAHPPPPPSSSSHPTPSLSSTLPPSSTPKRAASSAHTHGDMNREVVADHGHEVHHNLRLERHAKEEIADGEPPVRPRRMFSFFSSQLPDDWKVTQDVRRVPAAPAQEVKEPDTSPDASTDENNVGESECVESGEGPKNTQEPAKSTQEPARHIQVLVKNTQDLVKHTQQDSAASRERIDHGICPASAQEVIDSLKKLEASKAEDLHKRRGAVAARAEDPHKKRDYQTTDKELAHIPAWRPIPECDLAQGDVVPVDWHWIVLADSMGYAYQGAMGQKDNKDYGVWVCIFSDSIFSKPCIKQSPAGEKDLACFRYHEVKKEFHFWGWNFSPPHTLQLVSRSLAYRRHPSVCDFMPGERVGLYLQHARQLQATQRGFMGNISETSQFNTKQYMQWACIPPHLISMPTGRHSTGQGPEEKDRPCVRWTSGSNRDTATYDLACFRYHEELDEFHFWEWNSDRPESRRIPFNRYYRPFSQLRESFTASSDTRKKLA